MGNTWAPRDLIMPPAANTATTIDLMWDPPNGADESIQEYRMYQNGSYIGKTEKCSFKAERLRPDTSYTFTVTSVHSEGLESAPSCALDAATRPLGETVDITEFGAEGDGVFLCTKAIQSAIDHCPPGGVVRVPAGIFLTGALFLKSDMTLLLEKGSKLLGVSQIPPSREAIAAHYPLIHSRYEGFHRKDIFASILMADGGIEERDIRPGKLRNISIIGSGTIDAQGSILAPLQTEAIHRSTRSNTITLINCENVYLQGITIENSPNWTIHPIYTKNMSTEGVTLHTETNPHTGERYHVSNCDGWDPDSSESMYLYNSILRTHDDNVAIKSGADRDGIQTGKVSKHIRITDCEFSSGGGIAIGSEMSGGVEDVVVRNVRFGRTDRGIQIKTKRGRGGFVKDILMKDIEIESAGDFGIMLNMRYYDDNLRIPEGDEVTTPVFENFCFENIHIGEARAAILMPGLPESHIHNVSLKNISIKADTGVQAVFSDDIRFENVAIQVKSGPVSHFKECQNVAGDITGISLQQTASKIMAHLRVHDSDNGDSWTLMEHLQLHDSIYSDKPNYIVQEFPEELSDCEWIRTANDSKFCDSAPLAQFSMLASGFVYVAYDITQKRLPDWLGSSWEETELAMLLSIPEQVKTIPFRFYRKAFTAGALVELGPVARSEETAMYTVVFKPI